MVSFFIPIYGVCGAFIRWQPLKTQLNALVFDT